MRLAHLLLAAVLAPSLPSLAQQVVTVDPKDVQLGPQRHKELPPALLKRIRAVTEVFEPVDGISYEQAVDLYKRDADPQANLVMWEEMARAYAMFCKARCATAAERADVYRALLLRSMFDEQEAVERAQPKVLSEAEVRAAVKPYRLAPKPIEVVQGKR